MTSKQLSKKIAIYPGTFDPPTLGHLDVIKTAAQIFNRLIVGVFRNPDKGSTMFSLDERLRMVQKMIETQGLKNVKVVACDRFTADFSRRERAGVRIRGLRLTTEYEHELEYVFHHDILSDGEVDTVLIPSRQGHMHIRSILARSLIDSGPIEKLVQYLTPEVIEIVKSIRAKK